MGGWREMKKGRERAGKNGKDWGKWMKSGGKVDESIENLGVVCGFSSYPVHSDLKGEKIAEPPPR